MFRERLFEGECMPPSLLQHANGQEMEQEDGPVLLILYIDSQLYTRDTDRLHSCLQKSGTIYSITVHSTFALV